MSNNIYILILYGNIAQKTYVFRRNICARNIISTKWQLSAALYVWNGQILARSECNYIIWTRSSLAVLEDFTSIPHVHVAEFALTLEDCIRLYVCERHNDVSPRGVCVTGYACVATCLGTATLQSHYRYVLHALLFAAA